MTAYRREAAASDEQQLRTPEDGRIAQLSTETLVTRINSLLYIEENLPAMEKIVQDRSAPLLFPPLPPPVPYTLQLVVQGRCCHAP